jgi:uncharacterized protein YqfA (UPF0365 family)
MAIVILSTVVFGAMLALLVFWLILGPWLRAFTQGMPVSAIYVLGIRLRGTPSNLLVDAYMRVRRVGVLVDIWEIEQIYLDHKSEISTTEDLLNLIRELAKNTKTHE